MRSIVLCGGLLLLSMTFLSASGGRHCLESDQAESVPYGHFEAYVRERCFQGRQVDPLVALYVFCFRNGCYQSVSSLQASRDAKVDTFFVLHSDADLCESCRANCVPFDSSSLD